MSVPVAIFRFDGQEYLTAITKATEFYEMYRNPPLESLAEGVVPFPIKVRFKLTETDEQGRHIYELAPDSDRET